MLSYLVGALIVARALGITVNLAQVAGASAVSYFLTMVPVSINGYGIRELVVLWCYAQLGATVEQATALAFLTRIIMLFLSLPGAISIRAFLPGREGEGPSGHGAV